VVERQGSVRGQDAEDLEIGGVEQRRAIAVVELQDAEHRVVPPERDADGALDIGTEQRLRAERLGRGICGQHCSALTNYLPEDTASDRHGLRRLNTLALGAAHAREDGYVHRLLQVM